MWFFIILFCWVVWAVRKLCCSVSFIVEFMCSVILKKWLGIPVANSLSFIQTHLLFFCLHYLANHFLRLPIFYWLIHQIVTDPGSLVNHSHQKQQSCPLKFHFLPLLPFFIGLSFYVLGFNSLANIGGLFPGETDLRSGHLSVPLQYPSPSWGDWNYVSGTVFLLLLPILKTRKTILYLVCTFGSCVVLCSVIFLGIPFFLAFI